MRVVKKPRLSDESLNKAKGSKTRVPSSSPLSELSSPLSSPGPSPKGSPALLSSGLIVEESLDHYGALADDTDDSEDEDDALPTLDDILTSKSSLLGSQATQNMASDSSLSDAESSTSHRQDRKKKIEKAEERKARPLPEG